MANTGYRTSSSSGYYNKDSKHGGQKKSSALGRFMSFIRGKDKDTHISKRGISARQKSTDSGISSNRDTYINSDENLPAEPRYGGNYDINKNRPCSTIKVVRNNSQIQSNSIGKINHSAYNNSSSHSQSHRDHSNHGSHQAHSTKRTQSTLGVRGKGRPNVNVKRSNTSIGNVHGNRLNRHNMGHTSDSSTSSTGYISDHRNRNNHPKQNQNNFRDNSRNNFNNNNSNNNSNNNNSNNNHSSNSKNVNNNLRNNTHHKNHRRRDEPTSASESSSEASYSSSDNSSYTSEESNTNPRKNAKTKKHKDPQSKANNSYNNNCNSHYSEDDDTSHAATSIADSHRYDDEDAEDEDKSKDNPAQLEAIPEGEEEEERYLHADRKRSQEQNVTSRLSQLQAKNNNFNPNKYNNGRNSRKPMHSYHGNSADSFDDNDECLLKEAQKGNNNTNTKYPRIPKGRSFSTDGTTSTTNANENKRQNWRTPRKSFGENQLRSLPPGPSGKNSKSSKGGSESPAKVDTNNKSLGVRALVNRIQTQTDVVEDSSDPYLATKFEYARKTFGRNGSREGNLSEDNNLDPDNDDPLFEAPVTSRRAGMTQARDGRAYLSRKNSFNNKKQAQESGRMAEQQEKDLKSQKEKESLEPKNSGGASRPRGATVQRSTSRVKQIAMSLHERETTVRKTEAMIANHQPLDLNAENNGAATGASGAKAGSDHASIGHPSPLHRRANSKQANKTDDSFIKELLEIARAESQEKQKGTEITFTPALLKNIASSNSSLNDKAGRSPDNDKKQYDRDSSDLGGGQNSPERKRVNSLREDSPFGLLEECEHHSNGGDISKPKDFKEAISMASTRLTRKKNSKDCSLERELDGVSNNGTLKDMETNSENLGSPSPVQNIKSSKKHKTKKNKVLQHANSSPAPQKASDSRDNLDDDDLIHQISQSNLRKGRVLERQDLPYSTVPPNQRRRSRLSSQEHNNTPSPKPGGTPKNSVNQRAKMFEQTEQNHQRKQTSMSREGHISSNTIDQNRVLAQRDSLQLRPQCSNSSGIYSGNPDESECLDRSRETGGQTEFSDSLRNQKEYYNNLINKVKNLKQRNSNPGTSNDPRGYSEDLTSPRTNTGLPPLSPHNGGGSITPMSGRSPSRSLSPSKSFTASGQYSTNENSGSNLDENGEPTIRTSKTTRIIKKKRIIRKIRSSVDKDGDAATRTRGKLTL